METIQAREYQTLELEDRDLQYIKEIIFNNQRSRNEEDGNYHQLLQWSNGKPRVKNYVGILPLQDTVIEIFPKISVTAQSNITECEKQVFYDMLRCYRNLEFIQIKDSDIEKIKKFTMLEAFIYLFLQQVLNLVKRGIISNYHTLEDNLPYLKGRLKFPQQAITHSINKTQFYVRYDVYSQNTPINRLINKTLYTLSPTRPENQRLRWQLLSHFDGIPSSHNQYQDWQQSNLDRSMEHYQTVKKWVGLFLFQDGLATFCGDYKNKSLLFPMEKIFESFVEHHFQQYYKTRRRYSLTFQKPRKSLTKYEEQNQDKDMFQMKPDIVIKDNKEGTAYILDTKWKLMSDNSNNKFGIRQGDMYQLFSYGKIYNCKRVALIYPQNSEQFTQPLRFQFNDNSGLQLLCFPFDIENPQKSVKNIYEELHSVA